jgi:hypothetical protein
MFHLARTINRRVRLAPAEAAMVVSRGTRPKTVVEIDKANAQSVSPSTTTRPLSAPNLRSRDYYRVRTAQWRGGGRLRKHANPKR